MPTYEYKCEQCGVYDWVQSITEPVLELCPHCGGSTKRLISRSVGIVFKGSGFYVNDSRSNSAGKGSSEKETGPKESTEAAGATEATGATGATGTKETTDAKAKPAPKESAKEAAGESKPKAEAS